MRFLFVLLLLVLSTGHETRVQAQSPLATRWAAEVTSDNVLPEYPRPQMVRERWLNLNGLWEYALTIREGTQPETFDGPILVPFPIESALSGVEQRIDGRRLWYRRSFSIPDSWAGERVLLHFGAVDWQATVWVNGQSLGTHSGGYDPFSFDITEALIPGADQALVVSVWDPTEGTQPRGKQVLNPDGIWYTPTTGIWQTVWLEPVPESAITSLRLTTDIDAGTLTLMARVDGEPLSAEAVFSAQVLDDNGTVAEAAGTMDEGVVVVVPNARLWSPDSPHLYDIRVTIRQDGEVVDEVISYFGMREIAVEADVNGVPRLFLNHQPLFQFGLLDQGFWPDGLYTAPTDEALRHDIEVTRDLGFNLIRKHVKVEPERWYYWADRLGVLVWQDMPSGDAFVDPGQGDFDRSARSAAQFELELQRMIDARYNHPSIVMWVLFNEGWGQYDTVRLTEWIAAYDPTRLVNSASGWNDFGVGDVSDVHAYPGPAAPVPDGMRASVLGEFGGLGLPVAGHTWLDENSWGYREYDDAETLLAAYTELIAGVRDLQESAGLAAAVYTQTTDVETEVNGIMTYDRAIIKMDADSLRAVNAALFAAGGE